jgi:hypothetical protein
MKITACLCWYDEPLELLMACVGSLGGLADELVALDGRWNHFPGDAFRSPQEQSEAIFGACHATGLKGVLGHPAYAPFASQVEKRQRLVDIATMRDADWLLIVDADEHVLAHDRDALELALIETQRDVAELELTNLAQEWPLNELPIHTYRTRRLFRAAARPRYELAHNGVRSAGGAWLNGDHRHVDLVAAVDVSAAITIGHACDARPKDRQKQRIDYYRARNAAQLEDWSVAA